MGDNILVVTKATESSFAMGWEQAMNNWSELPRGVKFRTLWVNPAIYPIYGVVAAAATLNVCFLGKYFMGNVDIHFKKSERMSHEMAINDSRVNWHNSHVGLRDMNKKNMSIFPFNWRAKSDIIKDRTGGEYS